VRAISDVSFDIRKGEIRAIIGPNGAGKTSMLNVINGFYHPQKGAHRFAAGAFAHEAARGGGAGHRAHVPERRAVQGHDDARQHHDRAQSAHERQPLLAGAAPRAGARRGDRASEFCEEIIDFLEIEAIRKTPVGKLPYGLQKRVELGRALAMEPRAPAARRADGRHEPRGERRT
jgi:branched-chain amino acid transport system ATP-binding protein